MEGAARHVLLLGATGLIGSATLARLRHEGMRVTAVARRCPAIGRGADERWVRLDLRHATRPEDWAPLLAGVDAVVNCAGVLQDGGGDASAAVHRDAPAALYAACRAAGVRRIVHLSAMGAEGEALSAFSQTKREGEAALEASGLDWVILRPSVVVGRPAHGGSALIRGLASLPVLPALEAAGRIRIAQLDDLVETIIRLLRRDAPAGVAIAIGGPEALPFETVVARYRHWLGWPPARIVHLPRVLLGLLYRLGDLAGWLGWRPPIRTTARREMVRGAATDPAEWTRLSGIVPRGLDEALAGEPASVQERWFARLYLLKPLILGVFGLYWIATGLVSLGPGYQAGVALMQGAGAGAASAPVVILGGLADIAIGAAILYRRTARLALWAALLLSLFYLAAGTIIVPALWADPLGPLLKVAPILVLNLVALAVLEDR